MIRSDRQLTNRDTDRNETCNVHVLKEEAMTNRPHRTDIVPPFSPPLSDEGSSVRERPSASRASSAPASGAVASGVTRQSDPNLSLDQRLESKLGQAQALLARLEPQDARARLLHIAVLRRDEALLDGILAELALPPRTRRGR